MTDHQSTRVHRSAALWYDLVENRLPRYDILHEKGKKMTDHQITAKAIDALESNLRAFEDQLVLFRKLVQQNPNYSGNWLDHKQWMITRRAYRQMCSAANPVLKKRHAITKKGERR